MADLALGVDVQQPLVSADRARQIAGTAAHLAELHEGVVGVRLRARGVPPEPRLARPLALVLHAAQAQRGTAQRRRQRGALRALRERSHASTAAPKPNASADSGSDR